MIEIISAKAAARKTVKANLQREIPLVNEKIEGATQDGKKETYYDGDISEATVKMLEKAGYTVDNWDVYDARTRIFWGSSYKKVVSDEAEMGKIAEEAAVAVTKVQ